MYADVNIFIELPLFFFIPLLLSCTFSLLSFSFASSNFLWSLSTSTLLSPCSPSPASTLLSALHAFLSFAWFNFSFFNTCFNLSFCLLSFFACFNSSFVPFSVSTQFHRLHPLLLYLSCYHFD